jgi:DNA-binding NarL/FixJ family response regulator
VYARGTENGRRRGCGGFTGLNDWPINRVPFSYGILTERKGTRGGERRHTTDARRSRYGHAAIELRTPEDFRTSVYRFESRVFWCYSIYKQRRLHPSGSLCLLRPCSSAAALVILVNAVESITVAPETIRIVIVDDHQLVRVGLRQVLSTAPEISVVAEGKSGADALRLVAEFHPDVLVLDVNLPDVSGVEVTRRVREQGAATAILILSIHEDRETVLGLVDAGATGYVLKDDATETLAGAIRAVACGESWLSPKIAGYVVRRARGETEPLSPLTQREVEVLRLVAQGLDNEAIAQNLSVTRQTVQNHVSTIYSKLGVTSRVEATLYAFKHKLVSVAPSGPAPDAR